MQDFPIHDTVCYFQKSGYTSQRQSFTAFRHSEGEQKHERIYKELGPTPYYVRSKCGNVVSSQNDL